MHDPSVNTLMIVGVGDNDDNGDEDNEDGEGDVKGTFRLFGNSETALEDLGNTVTNRFIVL
jgi:hypothetical protein